MSARDATAATVHATTLPQQRSREKQSLFLSLGERRDVERQERADLGELEHPAHRPRPVLAVNAVAAREQVEVLPDGHPFVDAGAVGHVAKDAPDALGMRGHVVPGYPRRARGWIEEGCEDAKRRRLPAPFGPMKP